MIIVGFDPGIATLGYGVIKTDPRKKPEMVDYGIVSTPKEENLAVRLAMLEKGVKQIIDTFNEDQIEEILDELFPVSENDSIRKKNNVLEFRQTFWKAYDMPDIAKFKDSAWKAVNAMSDVVTHSAPKRNTATFNENRWGKIMDGHVMFDQFVTLVGKKAA